MSDCIPSALEPPLSSPVGSSWPKLRPGEKGQLGSQLGVQLDSQLAETAMADSGFRFKLALQYLDVLSLQRWRGGAKGCVSEPQLSDCGL